jgi:biopolymer transport protein TolR
MAVVSSDDDFVSEINVTPFVDVMLVLLIIFMITAPMMTEGLDVELPKVEASETLPTENDHMILTIKDNGALFLDEYETTLDDLTHVLRTNVRDLGRQLFVRADKNVPYGMVMEVMGRIRGVGITDVGLVTVSVPPVSDGQGDGLDHDADSDMSGSENQP